MLSGVTKSTDDPKQRFSSRVDAYVAARPRYPREIIDHLRESIGLTPQWTIADIGSGTGISCELFLDNGNQVIGIEPNAPMRAAAEKSFAQTANFRSVNASAEATTLPDQSVDLIVAAQAFHWFDIDAARRECLRILRPGGWALLMWNDRNVGGTPFHQAYEKLLIDFGTDYLKIRHKNIAETDIARFFGSSGYRRAVFPNHQHLDFPRLRSRLLSSSYVPQENDPRHAPMLAELERIFAAQNRDGRVTIEYQTELSYGQPTYNS
jgi:SAM-dependent methyltransferase